MFKAPRQLPPLNVLLGDLGHPAPHVVARALGVSVRTVYGWQARDLAPRPAMLALFWESRFGRSAIAAESVNGERWARGLVLGLERERDALAARVAYLERVGDFGSANAPLLFGEPAQAGALHFHRDRLALPAR